MRFQVPQFINIEDKIFGPLTLKQFIYVAGGGSIAVVFVLLFDMFFGLLLSSPIVLLSLILAFYKINDRPFVHILESAFKYATKDKLYIWIKKEREQLQKEETKKYTSVVVPNISKSKLKDMSWELDIKNNKNNIGV